VIAVYQASLDKMRRGPQGGATPFARPSAATPAPQPFPTPALPAAFAIPAPAGVRHAVFRGSGTALFGIHVINALLILATAGIYFFWAKVRVRSYLWSESEFEGDRFAYHGTGRELITGFAKAVLFFFLPITLLNTAPEMLKASPLVVVAARLAVSILAAVFIPIAMVGARRYRLSRISWRGIRFSLRASTREFIGIWVRGWMLTSLTLGLYYPFFVTSQQRFLTGHMWFGSQRFTFDGRGRDLVAAWLGTIVLFVPTLGLSWFWFAAKRQRALSLGGDRPEARLADDLHVDRPALHHRSGLAVAHRAHDAPRVRVALARRAAGAGEHHAAGAAGERDRRRPRRLLRRRPRAYLVGGPEMAPPTPQTLGAPRRSRGTPRYPTWP
jgi:hypothetical protein